MLRRNQFDAAFAYDTNMKNNFSSLFRYWKLISIKKLLYFPRILTAKEKSVLFALFLVAIISGVTLISKSYIGLTASKPAVGGSYTEGIFGEPRVINPIFATNDAERDIARLMYGSLISYDHSGNIINDLAEKYEVSGDGKIYTVTLRKNALWHDSTPVTAEDVAFTVHTIQNTQFKSPLRPSWQGVNVEIVDPYTVRFILRAPYAPFVENLSVGILPKHLWEKITPEQALLHQLNLKPIGSGPYQFSQIRQEKDGTVTSYSVTRNPHYYREGPYIGDITFMFFHTEDDLITAVRTKKIDGYGPISEKLALHINKNISKIYTADMPRVFGIFFNQQKNKILADDTIRNAIALALDRKNIADNVMSGGATPFGYPLPNFLKLHENNVPDDAFNPEQAKKILDKAGWQDKDGTGVREKSDPKIKTTTETPKLSFVLTTSDWPDLVKTAQIIRDELHTVGIEVIIETHSYNELESQIIRPRNFQILLFGQVYGYEADPFPFWHSSQIKDPGLNISLYQNKKVDRMLEEARKTTDMITRESLYQDFEAQLMRDTPAIFLYSQTFLYLLPQDIQGVTIEKIALPADRFNEINTWFRATKRVFKK